ncbi:ribosomal protein S5 domain 2-like protein [Saccharata proteae CBS 121410]|uniref:Ribosomal protein S5 domain 2-like protein n=1 Tax=Saccharata proteae CBS 121410 TaxID=1314787 RepID=A0A6A5YB37_9PEZI|nr:ribosomal protein S5 domain 2-like protein [Saccharata proteae CBS 121410]
MSAKRKRSSSPSASSPGISISDIYRSAPIEDRASIFIGHYSATLSAKALQALPELKSASHRIAAWRKPSSQRTVLPNAKRLLETGYDDDGEKYAGRKLEKVLEEMGLEGALVVARWYGGVMLGPVRFAHIENCAKQAIRLSKAAEAEAERAEAQKRLKVKDEQSRDELEQILKERDQSIDILRGLLAEKTRAGPSSEHADAEKPPVTPKKPLNYGAMPLQALRKLETARDATIAFILKEIDKAEEKKQETTADDEFGPDLNADEVEELQHLSQKSANADTATNEDNVAHPKERQ